MRIAIDIDCTLHHYWDQLEAAAKRRFGVELPYAEQLEWTIDRLRPEQVEACVAETHTDERILAAEPYAGAVETVRALARGRATSSTSPRTARIEAHGATARWLERIGLPYDELYCSCGQGRPLPRDRHRPADRRLAREPARRGRGRDRRRHARAPVEPGDLRGGGHRLRAGLARARDAALAPLLEGAPR